MVSRFFGLNTIIFSSRSVKEGEKSFRKLDGLEFVETLISLIMDFDTSDSRETMSYSLG
jgi:hypothetical protein